MNDNPDYAMIARRIENGEADRSDAAHVAELAGLEIVSIRGVPRVRSGNERGWRDLPNLSSADDFERFVLDRGLGNIDDIGRDKGTGTTYASYCDRARGNDYGYSDKLGRAFWAAYVRVAGDVDGEDEAD